MSIKELLATGHNANITVAIGLQDLKEWHEEVVENKCLELANSIKTKEAEEYLSSEEVMDFLKVSRSTLTRWRRSGFLVPAKVGRACKYPKSDIAAILNSQKRG